MGHQIYKESFPLNCDKKKVQEYFDSIARHEDYFEGASGLPASIRWLNDVVLENKESAEKWIEDNENPWYDQLAVKYHEYPELKLSAKYKTLQDRLSSLQKSYKELSSKFHFSNAKSEFIGCKSCGSRIRRKHLKGNYCPVCGKDLRPISILERIKKAKEKYERLQAALEEEKRQMEKKQIKNSKLMYLVKVEFHV